MTSTSRRNILTATAAGSMLAAAGAGAAQAPQDAADRAARGAADPEPQNAPLQNANPSENTPPPTDRGNLGTMKYSFSKAHNRRTAAVGRARSRYATSLSPNHSLG
jgi:oxalate decarboxylase